MAHLQRDNAALVVVDVQEGFRSSDSFAGVAAACAKLLAAARILGVPARLSEP
jgi:nicotinamidase-related amidase